jgi:hypothetical protein
MQKETIRVWYNTNEYKNEGLVQYFPTFYDKDHTLPAGAQLANGTVYKNESNLGLYNDFSFYYFYTDETLKQNPTNNVDTLVVPTVLLYKEDQPDTRTFPVEFTSRILWGNGKYQNAVGTATFTFRKDGTRQTVFDIEY